MSSDLVYDAFAKKVRKQTEKVCKSPLYKGWVQGMRAQGYEIDHKISVKAGFALKISPEKLASPENLWAIPAPLNRMLGAKEEVTKAVVQNLNGFGFKAKVMGIFG